MKNTKKYFSIGALFALALCGIVQVSFISAAQKSVEFTAEEERIIKQSISPEAIRNSVGMAIDSPSVQRQTTEQGKVEQLVKLIEQRIGKSVSMQANYIGAWNKAKQGKLEDYLASIRNITTKMVKDSL